MSYDYLCSPIPSSILSDSSAPLHHRIHPTTFDTAIVGGGPVGLFAVFELGTQGGTAAVIDALPQLGGQCSELYPSKPIYDIPGFPSISGIALTENLRAQIAPFDHSNEFFTHRVVTAVHPIEYPDSYTFEGGEPRFLLRLESTVGADLLCILAGTIFFATGNGLFTPRKLTGAGIEAIADKVRYAVPPDFEVKPGEFISIFGGGDSAFDWALYFADKGCKVDLFHRSTQYRAQPHSVEQARHHPNINLLVAKNPEFTILGDDFIGIGSEEFAYRHYHHVFCFYGMITQPGVLVPVAEHYGIDLSAGLIPVNLETFAPIAREPDPGIYFIGDCNSYPGKMKLILSGFHEAAMATMASMRRNYPNRHIRFEYTTASVSIQQRLGVSNGK